MSAGAGLRGQALAQALFAAGLCLWTQMAAGEEPNEPGGTTRAAGYTVALEYYPTATAHSCLRRVFNSSGMPRTRLALSYYHSLVQYLNFGPAAAGPAGELLLPGNRRFTSDLEFSIITSGRSRRLVPGLEGAALTVMVTPPAIREQWVWPDGVVLQRIFYQPASSLGAGIRFSVKNLTGRPLEGLRLAAILGDPLIGGRCDPAGCRTENGDLFADPRDEILYLREAETREESWMAFGWGPQGGLMSGGEQAGEAVAFSPSNLTVHLETPAWDLLPGQSHEADFWLLWDYDQESVSQGLLSLRRQGAFTAWQKRSRRQDVSGVEFTCRDDHVNYLFQSCKAWGPWLRRRDAFGNAFITGNLQTEAASPRELAAGAAGYIMAGGADILRESLENWMEQRADITDVASIILAIERYMRWTQDWRWFQGREFSMMEMLESLTQYDRNGDGLPEYGGMLATEPDDYNPFYNRSASARRSCQFLRQAVTGVRALRAGADLMSRARDPEGRSAVPRYRMLAEMAERSLDAEFWHPKLGRNGYYAYARLPGTGELAAHRGLAAADTVLYGLGALERRNTVFQELWNNPSWRTPGCVFRTLPADDGDFSGDNAAGRGQNNYEYTHALLLAALRRHGEATEAVRRLQVYAHEFLDSAKTLGGWPRAEMLASSAEVSEFNFIELLIGGLAGLEPVRDGLRVSVPRYRQDLQVRVTRLPVGTGWVNAEIDGAGGAQGLILVDGEPLADGGVIPYSRIERRTVNIAIKRK